MTSSVGLRIEATEFPELVQRYGVMGVPKIVINERVEVEGAIPEHAMFEMIFAAAEARATRSSGRPPSSSPSRRQGRSTHKTTPNDPLSHSIEVGSHTNPGQVGHP